MAPPSDSPVKINLSLVSVLVIDASTHGLDIMSQIVKGFGAQEIHRCSTVAEAERVVKRSAVDLIIADPALKDGDGFEFLNWLRNSNLEPNRFAPIILVSGHSTPSRVAHARDAGANFFVVKPVSPKVLLERILWIERDKRDFVATSRGYCGPDRRFKFDGPPGGADGRREGDLTTPLGDAVEPNMSQAEINNMLKPQRVSL